jgi:hypothetical protein
MHDLAKMAIAGGVAIGLVTAFGLHAKNLGTLAGSAGKATSGLTHTLETGN